LFFKNNSWVWWYTPIVPATQEVEARESLGMLISLLCVVMDQGILPNDKEVVRHQQFQVYHFITCESEVK
jgi:hypothetical protein